MFRTDLLSIIGSLTTVFTAVVICQTSDINCLRHQAVYINSMANTSRCEYSIKTPDDGQ